MSTGKTVTTQTNFASKKLLGKAHTSNLKTDVNESIPSNVSIPSKTVFGEDIPNDPGVEFYTLYSASVAGGGRGTVEQVYFDIVSLSDTIYDGNDPGAGMNGGLIIINGRCPNPPEGVTLRPVTKTELTKINKELDVKDFQIPNDSVCLECTSQKIDYNTTNVVSSGDMSTIGLVPTDTPHKMNYITCDTVALIGERGETNTPIALPLPLMPLISDGEILSKFKSDNALVNRIETQPFIASINPRAIDFALISQANLNFIGQKLAQCGGMVIDMMGLPSMNSEEIDGMLVSLRSLLGQDKPFGFSNGVGRIDYLHKTSAYHRADMAISSIEDGTGISEPASLVLIGRSNKANLQDYYTESAINLGFSANADDIVKFCAAGLKLVCCAAPAEGGPEINNWLNEIHVELSKTLQRIGLESIDSLSRQNLRALDYETAAVSGLRLVGYERPLPHWFAR